MDKLTYELRELCHRNRDGSHATQADRIKRLSLVASQLSDMGYKNLTARSLKTKHVEALVKNWSTEVSKQTGKPISAGTIKNRMTDMRWWAGKINKQNVVPRTNRELNIPDRQRLPNHNKAFTLKDSQTNNLPLHIRYSLQLQEAFGLRREEAAKFTYSKAVDQKQINILASWAKGGRARTIPVTNEKQASLLREIKLNFENKSLIPEHLSYKQYLSHREFILNSANIKATHGLRHHYAQQRYNELSGGLVPPRQGGTFHSALNADEKERDLYAREIVSNELGHGRIEITRVYLG